MEKYKNVSDEELVKIVRDIDKELYLLIVKRYEAKLLRYVNYLINDDAKASDAVQETFIKAFINLNGFNVKKKFSSWIYRIAHNESVNIVKKYNKEVQLDPEMDLPDNKNIDDEYDKNEIVKMARKCLSKMPIIYSEPLELYYLEDKSYEEVGDILRLNVGTVGTRINRAKIIMKKICQKKN